VISRWSDRSPLCPHNHDLSRLRRRQRRRRRHGKARLVRYLPGYRRRVVPDPEPLLGLTAQSAPLPRATFAACLTTTTRRERRRHGYAVLQTIRRGKWE
jgi:hypothetical protein